MEYPKVRHAYHSQRNRLETPRWVVLLINGFSHFEFNREKMILGRQRKIYLSVWLSRFHVCCSRKIHETLEWRPFWEIVTIERNSWLILGFISDNKLSRFFRLNSWEESCLLSLGIGIGIPENLRCCKFYEGRYKFKFSKELHDCLWARILDLSASSLITICNMDEPTFQPVML